MPKIRSKSSDYSLLPDEAKLATGEYIEVNYYGKKRVVSKNVWKRRMQQRKELVAQNKAEGRWPAGEKSYRRGFKRAPKKFFE